METKKIDHKRHCWNSTFELHLSKLHEEYGNKSGEMIEKMEQKYKRIINNDSYEKLTEFYKKWYDNNCR